MLSVLPVFYSVLKSSYGLLLQQTGFAVDDLSDPAQLKLIVILLIVFAFIAIFGLFFVIKSYRELKKQYRIIESQHKEIAEKNEELAFKNDSLEELNMEKNNMISVVAHDLKAPLGNIQGLIELIKLDQNVLTKEQRNYIELLRKVSHDTAAMVDVMLNVHRIESELHQLALHDYDIIDLIKKSVKLHEPAASLKKVEIQFDPKIPVFHLKTDKQYFQQIVSNILQNAVDHSPEDSYVTISLVERSSSVAISIRDTGVGISESDQKRLFSGYRRMKDDDDKRKSAGFGLAIVMRLLEKLHGRIDVKSAPGKGSTFTIELVK
jgi:signal transduction histidine kinase